MFVTLVSRQRANTHTRVSMTRSSIKTIYLTLLLWTLTGPFLRCFSLTDPLKCIALLTSVQSLQAFSLKVSEETYDKLNEAIQNNPNLLKQLIAQAGSSKSKLSSSSQGSQFSNGISNILPRYGGTGAYSIKTPVALPLNEEIMIDNQKYIVTNRLSLFGNFLRRAASAAISPISNSLNYLKTLGQNQGVSQDVLKFISNKLKKDDGDENEEEVEKKPKKPKKPKNKRVKEKKVVKNSANGGGGGSSGDGGDSDGGGSGSGAESGTEGGSGAGGTGGGSGAGGAGGGSGTGAGGGTGDGSGIGGSSVAGDGSGTGGGSGAGSGTGDGSGTGGGSGAGSGTGDGSGEGGNSSEGGGNSGED